MLVRQISDRLHFFKPIQACCPWGCRYPQILADQLTLYQLGGLFMPPHHYWHPRIFRPSYGPAITEHQTSQISICAVWNVIGDIEGT